MRNAFNDKRKRFSRAAPKKLTKPIACHYNHSLEHLYDLFISSCYMTKFLTFWKNISTKCLSLYIDAYQDEEIYYCVSATLVEKISNYITIIYCNFPKFYLLATQLLAYNHFLNDPIGIVHVFFQEEPEGLSVISLFRYKSVLI